MWRYLKKLVIGIVASLLLVLGSGPALASGIPVYQYTNSQSVNGYVYYGLYDWHDPNLGYVKNIYQIYQPSPNGFFGTFTLGRSGSCNGNILVQTSNDAVNWTNILQYSYGCQTVDQTVTISSFSQYIRVLLYTGASVASYAYSGTISVQIYSLSADEQTAQTAADNATNAMNAANSANSAAQAAQTAAQNAENGTNTIINSYLSTTAGVVQDSSGTVLTASRAAQLAANQADTDIKSAQSALQSSINSVQSSVTNITNYLPPTLNKVSGYNGATATSATSFKVALDYSNATDYQYQIDGGSWSGWNSLSGYNGYISVSGLSTSGMHTITVKVRNGVTGPTAQGSMNVFKL